jgi:phosphatidylethanolamine/phosphatidyl-N-methylethanolamine N-methyltransferase
MEENDFYSGVYRPVQEKGLTGWYVKKSHTLLERMQKQRSMEKYSILEVGGNVGEHIKYVSPNYSSYTLSDSRNTNYQSLNSKIHFKIADVQNLPFLDNSFDRTISTCLLHHVIFPIRALEEIRRVTKKEGLISLLVPSDPGFAYQLAKKLAYQKNGKSKELKIKVSNTILNT